jgi:glucosamine--fructose-6-phosphate aminotransferase (isomerizing)
VSSVRLSQLELEVREQGDVLAARTEAGWGPASRAADVLRRDDVDHLVIAARGTSDNAARYAQYLLGMEVRLPVGLAAPWLYSSDSPPLLARGAVLAISQSGRSPDIVRVVEVAALQGRPTVAITNDLESPLAVAADVVVPLLAGEERSVAATKTYLASLHAIAQITACLSGSAGSGWFKRLPELVSTTVEEQLATRSRFDPLDRAAVVTVVGRGLQLPTAHETGLKVRELSGIPAEAFSLPDLMHGPIAAVRPSGAVWLVSTAAREQPERIAFDGVTVAVSDRDELVAAADIGVRIQSGLPEWVAPIVAVIPGQAAALRLGELHGVNLDQPHGLRKVTLTR